MTERQLPSSNASRTLRRQRPTTSMEPKGKQIPDSGSQTACRRKRRQRTVRFSRDATQEHTIGQCQNLSVQEINERWYNQEEYEEIRQENHSTVKLLRNGLTDPERVGLCYRGLEHKTMERRRQRSINVIQSLDSVLLEQKRIQLKGSKPDPRAIANSYSAISKQCQNDAHRIGVWDEKNVQVLWRIRGDHLPRMPRRTWAKGA